MRHRRQDVAPRPPGAAPYPCRFGHETAGVRVDTGERVLVSDSVACGACAPCRAGRTQICRDPTWVLGGFAERIAAPAGALHPIPGGLPAAAAAMAEPLAAALHAVSRGSDATDVGVLGGGPMGLMLASLLIAQGRTVTVAERHPDRRAQASARRPVGWSSRATSWCSKRSAGPRHGARRSAAAAPGGVVVLVGGCPSGTEVSLPTAPIHYDELDLRGTFHHSYAEVDEALALLAAGPLDWRALAGDTISLEELPAALAAPAAGRRASGSSTRVCARLPS